MPKWWHFAVVVVLWLTVAPLCPSVAQQNALDDAKVLNDQVITLSREGRYAEAVPIAQRVLAMRESQSGLDQLYVASALNNLAFLYVKQGRYSDTEPLFRRALTIRENVLGPDHLDVATVVTNLAELFCAQGRFIDAEPLYRRALAIREKELGPEHVDLAMSLNNLGMVYYYEGRFADVEPLYRRSLTIWEKVLGPEHSQVATSLNNLGTLYASQGRYVEAESLYRRSLAIRERASGPNAPDVATALINLASLYRDQGRYNEAEPLLVRSLAIYEKAFGPEHPNVAAGLSGLALLYSKLGRYTDAEPLIRRSLAIKEKVLGPNHPDVAEVSGNLAMLYVDLGRYAEAEPLLRQALAIYEKVFGRKHPNVSLGLNNLAFLYVHQGHFADAEPLFRQALTIKENALGLDHPDVALELSNLAQLYADQGRYAEAEPIMRRSLAIKEKAFGLDNPDVALELNNLGSLYQVQGRFSEAEPLLRRSLAIREKALGPMHPDVASALNNVATLLHTLGRDAEAEPLYQRSLEIKEKTLGPEHPDIANGLNNMALMAEARGHYADAEALYLRSLAIWENVGGPEHPNVALVLSNLALLYQTLGRHADAYPLARRAIAVLQRRGFDAVGRDTVGIESERRSVAVYFNSYLAIASSLANVEPIRSAAIAAESFQAAQLANFTSADRATAQMAARFAANSPELSRSVRERQDSANRRDALDRMLMQAASKLPTQRDMAREQQLRQELVSAQKTIDDLDRTLQNDFPNFLNVADPTPLALAEAQALLAPDEALVSFVVGFDSVFRFVVRKDGAEFREIKTGRRALELQIKALRLGLNLSGASASKLPHFDAGKAYEIYKTLFADIGSLLESARRLLIVPNGPLTGLPFSVLLTKPPQAGDTGLDYHKADWLIRDYSLSILPSVGSLKSLRVYAAKPQASRQPFVGFGDPDLKGMSNEASNQAAQHLATRGAVADASDVRQLEPLPETKSELQEIATALHADAGSVFVLDQATERRVKTMDLSQYRVIAFATHALTAGEFKGYAEPALVLTPPAQSDEIDDGLLAASEVAQLKLNADWIILSACNTAAADGTPGAPGLSGLARAFIYAGARALLVSHWDVDSSMAARLTLETVRLQQTDPKLSKAEALRRAMLAILDDPTLPPQYLHPAFWAPFFIVGD